MLRVVLDTNILISDLFWGGSPRRVVEWAKHGYFQALTSPDLLAEFEDVLAESFGLAKDEVERARHDVLSYAEAIAVLEEPEIPVRDVGDVKVLACALAGRADYVVTGDRDLLSLGPLESLRIVTVRAFLDAHAWPS